MTNVLLVTSWPPTRCGIARYAYKLVVALLRNARDHDLGVEIKILNASKFKGMFKSFRLLCLPCYVKDGADVVHIQHGFTLYGPIYSNILLLFGIFMLKLLRPKIKIVITLHSVPYIEVIKQYSNLYDLPKLAVYTFLGRAFLRIFFKVIEMASNKIIVHDVFSKYVLVHQYGLRPKRIVVIPHGVASNTSENETKIISMSKDRDILLAVLGFIRPHKDYITPVRMLNLLPPNIKLVIAGAVAQEYIDKTRKILYSVFKEMQQETNLINRVKIKVGFLSYHEYNRLLEKSDIILLPYRIVSGASGIIADSLGMGKLLLPSENPYFKAILGAKWKWWIKLDTKKDAESVLNLIISSKEQEEQYTLIRKLRDMYSWDRVSAKHLELYEKTKLEDHE